MINHMKLVRLKLKYLIDRIKIIEATRTIHTAENLSINGYLKVSTLASSDFHERIKFDQSK